MRGRREETGRGDDLQKGVDAKVGPPPGGVALTGAPRVEPGERPRTGSRSDRGRADGTRSGRGATGDRSPRSPGQVAGLLAGTPSGGTPPRLRRDGASQRAGQRAAGPRGHSRARHAPPDWAPCNRAGACRGPARGERRAPFGRGAALDAALVGSRPGGSSRGPIRAMDPEWSAETSSPTSSRRGAPTVDGPRASTPAGASSHPPAAS